MIPHTVATTKTKAKDVTDIFEGERDRMTAYFWGFLLGAITFGSLIWIVSHPF